MRTVFLLLALLLSSTPAFSDSPEGMGSKYFSDKFSKSYLEFAHARGLPADSGETKKLFRETHPDRLVHELSPAAIAAGLRSGAIPVVFGALPDDLVKRLKRMQGDAFEELRTLYVAEHLMDEAHFVAYQAALKGQPKGSGIDIASFSIVSDTAFMDIWDADVLVSPDFTCQPQKGRLLYLVRFRKSLPEPRKIAVTLEKSLLMLIYKLGRRACNLSLAGPPHYFRAIVLRGREALFQVDFTTRTVGITGNNKQYREILAQIETGLSSTGPVTVGRPAPQPGYWAYAAPYAGIFIGIGHGLTGDEAQTNAVANCEANRLKRGWGLQWKCRSGRPFSKREKMCVYVVIGANPKTGNMGNPIFRAYSPDVNEAFNQAMARCRSYYNSRYDRNCDNRDTFSGQGIHFHYCSD